jgi:hypothetical protein
MLIPCISLLFVATFTFFFESEGKETGLSDDSISTTNYHSPTMRENATARCDCKSTFILVLEYIANNFSAQECPQKTMIVLLILSKNYPVNKFKKVKEFVGLVVKSCNFSQYRVSFAYTGFHNVFDWRTDVATFDELQRTMPSGDFEWTLPPTPKELSHSVHQLVDSIGSVRPRLYSTPEALPQSLCKT